MQGHRLDLWCEVRSAPDDLPQPSRRISSSARAATPRTAESDRLPLLGSPRKSRDPPPAAAPLPPNVLRGSPESTRLLGDNRKRACFGRARAEYVLYNRSFSALAGGRRRFPLQVGPSRISTRRRAERTRDPTRGSGSMPFHLRDRRSFL